jgi:hypothetical protein
MVKAKCGALSFPLLMLEYALRFTNCPLLRDYADIRISNLNVRIGRHRDKDSQVLNLSGLMHGTFHQHLDDRFEVPWLGGHFVPKGDGRVAPQLSEG